MDAIWDKHIPTKYKWLIHKYIIGCWKLKAYHYISWIYYSSIPPCQTDVL